MEKRKWSAYRIFKTISFVLAFAAIVWFIIAFMVKPVVSVLGKAFFQNGTFSYGNIKQVLSSKAIQQVIVNTLVMAALTVVAVNIVGLFQILVTEYFDIKGACIIRFIFFVPLILTSISLLV